MATQLKEVDAVCIGVGWTGSILARELTKAGLKVVGLERGRQPLDARGFRAAGIRDELRYPIRQELFQDTQLETVSLRHSAAETALPIRRLGSFLPGTGVGGAGAHWNGCTWRILPSDHDAAQPSGEPLWQDRHSGGNDRSRISASPMTSSSPITTASKSCCGVSGKAGNLRGQKIDGGNVFEGPRADEYPNPPLAPGHGRRHHGEGVAGTRLSPVPGAGSANMSQAYTNPEGLTLGACEYCGHCERFGCEANAKASPQACTSPVLLAEPVSNCAPTPMCRN